MHPVLSNRSDDTNLQVKVLLLIGIKEVKANEPNCLQFEVFEECNGKGDNQIIVHEICSYAQQILVCSPFLGESRMANKGLIIDKDQASLDAHCETLYHEELVEIGVKEGLFARNFEVTTMKPFGGYRR